MIMQNVIDALCALYLKSKVFCLFLLKITQSQISACEHFIKLHVIFDLYEKNSEVFCSYFINCFFLF